MMRDGRLDRRYRGRAEQNMRGSNSAHEPHGRVQGVSASIRVISGPFSSFTGKGFLSQALKGCPYEIELKARVEAREAVRKRLSALGVWGGSCRKDDCY
ncbi:MAG: hypothetical protein LBG27_06480 [Spirochaetaceae bacterium]|nr:hypothetical protein [Spirochaetaceae bacterium]